MASGVETAGLALAILPLLVNQLDGYVRGWEKMKGFRRYRREIKGYRIGLSAQHAILLNTLELLLEDVVDDHEQKLKLIQNPTGDEWRATEFESKLRKKLGRDYDVFISNTTELSELLEGLSQRLGLGQAGTLGIESIGFPQAIKMILSRAVYDDLLAKIDTTNQVLKTLGDQSYQRGQARVSTRRKHGLRMYQIARKHAKVLYGAIVQGRCWRCLCRSRHSVYFQLDPKSVQDPTGGGKSGNTTQFTLILSTKPVDHSVSQYHWNEVEAIPSITDTLPRSPSPVHTTSHATRRVRFATGSQDQSRMTPQNSVGLPLCPQIRDLCSSLHQFSNRTMGSDLIGYIADKADTAKRYNMRFLREFQQEALYQSLHDILQSSSHSILPSRQMELSRRDRLFLAAVLASTVLQFHGTWLKQQWSIDDIKFSRDTQSTLTVIDRPYLSWQILDPPTTPCRDALSNHGHGHSHIRNPTLFPLALALIELSLGKPIAALCQPGDQDPQEDLMRRKTATRVLDDVYHQNGSSYGDVVKECLYWSRVGGQDFEDEKFTESVYDSVVSPLLKDFSYFEGISYAG